MKTAVVFETYLKIAVVFSDEEITCIFHLLCSSYSCLPLGSAAVKLIEMSMVLGQAPVGEKAGVTY